MTAQTTRASVVLTETIKGSASPNHYYVINYTVQYLTDSAQVNFVVKNLGRPDTLYPLRVIPGVYGMYTDTVFLPAGNNPWRVALEIDSLYTGGLIVRSALSSISTGFVLSPLEFTGFTAEKQNDNNIVLSWGTFDERNTDHFDIYRSENQKDFYLLNSTTAAGYSNKTLSYSLLDNLEGVNDIIFYKLVEVDKDGSINPYKNIIYIVNKPDDPKNKLYIKQQKEYISLYSENVVSVTLVSVSTGIMLDTKQFAGTAEMHVPVSGTYVVSYTYGDGVLSSQKINVVKN